MLRIGIMIDSEIQPAWIESMLADTLALPFVTLELVVVNGAPPGPTRGRLASWWLHRDHLLFAAFMRLDRWRHYDQATSPDAPRDVSGLLKDAPRLAIVPERSAYHDTFAAADVQRIRAYDLDVVVRLGFRILRGSVLDCARFGVWSYHHGDNRSNRGGPACVWEVLGDQATTGTVLQVLGPELDGGRVIYRSVNPTILGSVTLNQAACFWKSASFVPRKLRELYEYGDAAVAALDRIQPYTNRLFSMPRNFEMIGLWLRHSARRLGRKVDQLVRRRQWFLAYRFAEEADSPSLVFHRFKAIYPPKDRIWADPFVIGREGRFYIFFEEKSFSATMGHISVIELTRDGAAGPARPVLTCEHHLSYPCVFTWGGETYLLPESHDAGRLMLYRARAFPHEWEPVSQVLAESVVDATIAEIDGRWWLFATRRGAPGLDCDELYAYWSGSPLGPWTPHRRNPLKSDIRSARCAGRVFRLGDSWYRPAQYGARQYGSGIVLMRIAALSETTFEEVEAASLVPHWRAGLRGMHTLNADGPVTVIDLQRSIWRWHR